MVLLCTGFGTAAMMEGRPVQGRYSLAAARGGHFGINLTPTKCFCGNLGCVETEASTWNLSEISKRPEFMSLSPQKDQVYADFRTWAKHAKRKILEHSHCWNTAFVSGTLRPSP